MIRSMTEICCVCGKGFAHEEGVIIDNLPYCDVHGFPRSQKYPEKRIIKHYENIQGNPPTEEEKSHFEHLYGSNPEKLLKILHLASFRELF